MKPSEIKKQADALIDSGVQRMESYRAAVPLVFALRGAAATVKQFAKALDESAAELSRQAAAYAEEHPTALDTPLAEVKDGVLNGTVEIGGTTYRLTISPDRIKRLDGGNMTQQFLAGLPDGWTKSKLALVEGAFKGVDAEEMAKHDLRREIKREWSQAA
jgi:hypothetical protein